jgi:hypothetical protein
MTRVPSARNSTFVNKEGTSMRENMPGQGYPQGVGSVKDGKVSAQADWVDRGPRVLKYRTKGVFSDRVFTVETFDSVSERGRFRQDIRELSHAGSGVEQYNMTINGDDMPRLKTRRPEGEGVYTPDPYGMSGTARRHYTDALRDFFSTRIEQLTAGQQAHIASIMRGESLREAAAKLDVSHVAVLKARRRALAALVKLIGKHETDIANELIFFLKSEGGVALAGRLPDRVLAKSTVWRGHE